MQCRLYCVRWLLASLMLVGCGRAVMPNASPSKACEAVGDGCRCDDDSTGRYVCDDDALRCLCDGDDDEEEDGERVDAGRSDAGKDAGKRDSAPEPEPDPEVSLEDAGGEDADVDDASVPDPSGGPRIPSMPDECPTIETGTVDVLGAPVQLWVGAKRAGKRGPILFYWHGADTTSAEALGGIGVGHAAILAEGGVVAAFTTTTKRGTNSGNNLWYTGDFELADQVLACAIAQRDVDPQRVYTAGCGAGGLQASAMVYERSSYLAAAMASSGGTPFSYQLEDPAHVPAFIGAHGERGVDVAIVDFADATARQVKDLAAKGGLAVTCDHGGGTCASPAALKNAQWQFLKDHPFGVTPEPYTSGLPASFPSFCEIVPN